MAVNSIDDSLTIGALVDIASFLKISVPQGVYDVSYSPSDANFQIITSNSQNKFSNGKGILVVSSDQEIFLSNQEFGTEVSVSLAHKKSFIPTTTPLTLDTISTTSTYTQTGYAAKVIVIGGGQAGQNASNSGAAGGAGGKVVHADSVALPGNIPVVVGSGGSASFGLGGNSSFGSLSSASQGYTAPGGFGGSQLIGASPTAPASGGTPGTPGTPGEAVVVPTNIHNIIPLPYNAGAGGGYTGQGGVGGGGGQIAAGGGGGGGGVFPFPGNGNWRGGAGGGGGGGVPGAAGATGLGPYNNPAPLPTSTGGAGGAGRVFVLR